LILDPLYSYLDPTINAQNNQEIRRACESMTEVADGSRCTILGVRHLAKGQSGIALEQGLGAMSLIGVARHGLTVGADPTDATGTRRVLAVCKANLAERATSLCYEIEPSEDDPKVPRIRWGEASPLQADDLVSGSEDSEARVERTEASEFLWDLTADGPVTCDYARTQLKAAHLFRSDRTTRRAAKDARLVAIPSKTRQPTWFWGRRGQIAPPSLANPEQASDASVDGQAGLNRDYGEIGPSVANPEDVATLEADPATIRLNDL
jgi:hypothetical protein